MKFWVECQWELSDAFILFFLKAFRIRFGHVMFFCLAYFPDFNLVYPALVLGGSERLA